jgi:hypothetical protein
MPPLYRHSPIKPTIRQIMKVLIVSAIIILYPISLFAQNETDININIIESSDGNIRAYMYSDTEVASLSPIYEERISASNMVNNEAIYLQSPKRVESASRNLPSRRYEEVFSIGSNTHHITFTKPIAIELESIPVP